jgi:hypothetical protein
MTTSAQLHDVKKTRDIKNHHMDGHRGVAQRAQYGIRQHRFDEQVAPQLA